MQTAALKATPPPFQLPRAMTQAAIAAGSQATGLDAPPAPSPALTVAALDPRGASISGDVLRGLFANQGKPHIQMVPQYGPAPETDGTVVCSGGDEPRGELLGYQRVEVDPVHAAAVQAAVWQPLGPFS